MSIDNLGSGKSPQPTGEYTVTLMANKVIEVLEQLNIEKVAVVGHSLGGTIAQMMAISKPQLINRLILVSSFAKLDHVARYIESCLSLSHMRL